MSKLSTVRTEKQSLEFQVHYRMIENAKLKEQLSEAEAKVAELEEKIVQQKTAHRNTMAQWMKDHRAMMDTANKLIIELEAKVEALQQQLESRQVLLDDSLYEHGLTSERVERLNGKLAMIGQIESHKPETDHQDSVDLYFEYKDDHAGEKHEDISLCLKKAQAKVRELEEDKEQLNVENSLQTNKIVALSNDLLKLRTSALILYQKGVISMSMCREAFNTDPRKVTIEKEASE